MNDLTRRRVLTTCGVAAMGAVAGCQSSGEADEGSTENGQSGTVLGDITVENVHDEQHSVDVQVEFDGEIEHWTTHTVGEEDPTSQLERDWQTDPGPFRVRSRLDGGNLTEVTPATWNDPDCLNLLIFVDRSGDLSILSTPDGGACAESGTNAELETPSADDADDD